MSKHIAASHEPDSATAAESDRIKIATVFDAPNDEPGSVTA